MRKVIFLFFIFFQCYSMDDEEIEYFFKSMNTVFSGDAAKFWRVSEIIPKDYPKHLINNITRQFYMRYYNNMLVNISKSMDELTNENYDVYKSELSLDPNKYGIEALEDTLKKPILLSQIDYNSFLYVFKSHVNNGGVSLSETMFASVIRSKHDVENSGLHFEDLERMHITSSDNVGNNGKPSVEDIHTGDSFKEQTNYRLSPYWLSSGIIASSALMFYFWNKKKK